MEMIGDLRTDALHEALGRGPIEEDTLLALLVLAFAGQNVSVASGSANHPFGHARIERHAVRLISQDGKLEFSRDTLHEVARAVLSDVWSCRENRSASGIVARFAGEAIGADNFLPNMGTEDFLSCLSRTALEAACTGTSVLPRPRVKDTRAELVKHFADERFVPLAALFAPPTEQVTAWVEHVSRSADDDESEAELTDADMSVDDEHDDSGLDGGDTFGGFAEAAE